MRYFRFLLVVLAVHAFVSPIHAQTPGSGVTDVDGNTYPTVIIGTQEWMAANLKTTRYRNGANIPNVTDGTQWSQLTTGAWANYNNHPANDQIYGKLYNWYAVADGQNICPTGWHVPSDAEWSVLSDFLGEDVGFKMKSTSGWNSQGNGSNASGFNGLPGGFRSFGGLFHGAGAEVFFWSSTEDQSGGPSWSRYLYVDNRNLDRPSHIKQHGFAVRCIKETSTFKTIWKTDNPGSSQANEIVIPSTGVGYSIEWFEVANPSNSGTLIGNGHQKIVFPHPGTYSVHISGDFRSMSFYQNCDPNDDKLKIISVEQWGDIRWTTMESMFICAANVRVNATDAPDLSQVTSMRRMFHRASSFNDPVDHWDVSNVTDMSELFAGSPFNHPVGSWNVGNVTNLSGVFGGTSFNHPLENWDVSKVTDMTNLFREMPFNQDISRWNTSSVTRMHGLFYGNLAFNQDISQWDVSKVEDFGRVFFLSRFNQDISNWDVGSAKNMGGMFWASSFNGDISGWNVSNVESMAYMFADNRAFNGDISGWDVSNVQSMAYMFAENGAFNGDISRWNVSKLTTMDFMFRGNTAFSQSLRRWCVDGIQAQPQQFAEGSTFDSSNHPVWGLCPAKQQVFAWGNNEFNQLQVPLGLTDAVAVSAGYTHALVLLSDGSVVEFGDQHHNDVPKPSSLSDVTAIATGQYHNLALRSDGTVVQWGMTWRDQGQVPAGLDSVIAIAAGDNHSLALRANGQVVAWGNNDHGQSAVPPDLCPAVAISADAFSAALCRDGSAMAWGWTGQRVSPASLGRIHELSAGAWFITLLTDLGVAMWYADGSIQYPQPQEKVVALASEWHALALRPDGSAFGWNFNNYGQADVPDHVRNVTSIAAGRTHSIAVTAPYPLGYAPRMNAHDTYRRPVFRWTRPQESASYRIQISKSRSFASADMVYASSDLDSTVFQIPITLSPATTYYWRVSSDLNPDSWSWPQRFVTGMFALQGDEQLESWNLIASLRMAGQLSATATLGASHLATDGFDEGLDLALPPPPPGQTLRAWFSRPDWGVSLGPDFSSDIRAVRDLTTQVQRWTLSVRSEQAGELTLRLAPPGAGAGLPLSVRVDGREVSGMDSLSVVFQVQAGVTYAVLIEVGDLTAPVVRLAADLTGPAIWQAGESRQIGWQIEEANRVSRLHLQHRSGTGGWQTLYDGADTPSVSWSPGTEGEPTRRVWLRLSATDAAGNTGADSTSYPVTVVSPRQGIAFADSWTMASNPLMQASWAQQGPALRYIWQTPEYRQPQDLADAQGYWLGGYRAGADSLSGTVRSEASVLQLPAGWNLTGSGLMLDVLADSISVTHGGHGRSLPLASAVDSSWVTSPLSYDGAVYRGSEVFTPARGYWVGVSVPQGATLTLPIHRQDRPAGKQPAGPEPGLWLALRDGAAEHRLGVSATRTVAAPPAAPNSQRVGLAGPASALGSLYLQAKADPNLESAWPLVIGGETRTVELSWTDQDLPGMTAVLDLPDRRYDLTRANTVSLRSDESAQIVVGPISTSTEPGSETPLRTELIAAYPNPFNPSTVVSYRLSVSGNVRLAVYDVLGRQVALLADGNMSAGSHQVTFDASGLASGVYIYRLEAGGEVFTRRMTLVK